MALLMSVQVLVWFCIKWIKCHKISHVTPYIMKLESISWHLLICDFVWSKRCWYVGMWNVMNNANCSIKVVFVKHNLNWEQRKLKNKNTSIWTNLSMKLTYVINLYKINDYIGENNSGSGICVGSFCLFFLFLMYIP